jgi:hypothetical protein
MFGDGYFLYCLELYFLGNHTRIIKLGVCNLLLDKILLVPMLPLMNFYGNHNLDFTNNDHASLEYYTISEMRKIAIPNEIILMQQNDLLKQFQGHDISVLTKITEWCPISFPGSAIIINHFGGGHAPKSALLSIL